MSRADADLLQVSTLGALIEGVFEGAYPIGLLRKQGGFGVGTYNGIDGECDCAGWLLLPCRADDSVEESADSELVSFAAVTSFMAERRYQVTGMTMAQLDTYIASLIPINNHFYAIKVHGLFSSVTARAIPKLTPPYPALTEATAQETVFTRQGIERTVVIIRSPQYAANLNVAGDHYGFISDDHQFGGHALDLPVQSESVEVDEIRRNTLWLPTTDTFQQAPLPAPAK